MTHTNKNDERGFYSKQVARHWEEGLIFGNGHLGGLVFGDVQDETIVVSHAQLYMPLHRPLLPPDQASRLKEIRQLIKNGDYQKASQTLVDQSKLDCYTEKRWTDPFIPAFDLRLGLKMHAEIESYERRVNFETGLVSITWKDGRGLGVRKMFASRTDGVLVISQKVEDPTKMDTQIWTETRPMSGTGDWAPSARFENGVSKTYSEVDANNLIYGAEFKEQWEGSLRGYEGLVRVIVKNGNLLKNGNKIYISTASEILLLIDVELFKTATLTNRQERIQKLNQLPDDFESLYQSHAPVHRSLYGETKINFISTSRLESSSESLLASVKAGGDNSELIAKQFDAGRYAILSSSGDLFPNLQGMWTGTWGAPWSGDFTLNGNVQCALAASLNGNLHTCLLPFFAYHEANLEAYRTNAKRLFGTRGIHIPSRTSTHGFNNHFDATWPMTFWTAGAAWCAHFFWEYYLYTGDLDFLKNRALPFMKEAALFYDDFLTEDKNGKWLFSPSYSPENHALNTGSQACVNATMDIAAAKLLFKELLQAHRALRLNDTEQFEKWERLLSKMPEYLLTDESEKDLPETLSGAVKEWTTPLLKERNEHRHASHGYELYDGLPSEVKNNPTLMEGFRRMVHNRLAVRQKENGGIMAFGMVQLGLTAASLGLGEVVYETVSWLSKNFWNNNLVSTHDPEKTFNTDICGGFPALIIRMIMDSKVGELTLFPALPAALLEGEAMELKCRGQLTIKKLIWTSTIIEVVLYSEIDQKITITFGSNPLTQKLSEPVVALQLHAHQTIQQTWKL